MDKCKLLAMKLNEQNCCTVIGFARDNALADNSGLTGAVTFLPVTFLP